MSSSLQSARLQVISEKPHIQKTHCVLLAGQPNAGKTSLFNRLTGLKARTSNFPGTTVEVRKGTLQIGSDEILILDIPGLYGFEGDSIEQQVAQKALRGEIPNYSKPDILLVVLDATRLPHQLPFAGELREQGMPVIVALNMMDEARKRGLEIDTEQLSLELGAKVVPISARKKIGLDALESEIVDLIAEHDIQAEIPEALANCGTCGTCPVTARCSWADSIAKRVSLKEPSDRFLKWSDRVDGLLTNPWLGLPFFAVVMFALFYSVFNLATLPMDLIDASFSFLSELASRLIKLELLSSLISDGLILGLSGVVIFLPQIFILFFGISLLEDSGYLSRAVVASDRIMRKIGLPGQAFVPLLSAHACAIPAIMSTRIIENKLDRLRAILVIPLLTCSARLPVYLMISVLLFGNNTVAGSLLFFAGYFLGGLAAILMSLILQRTLVKGEPSRLAIELPPYRRPSFRVALYTAIDRSWVFLRDAGKIILIISFFLWAALTFPRFEASDLMSVSSRADRTRLVQIDEARRAKSADLESLDQEYQLIYNKYAAENSYAGRVGKFIEPVFEPLGFDWRISVGVFSSFAAREVIVSVLSVIVGVGDEEIETSGGLIDSLRNMKRVGGEPLFDVATSLSLFVFFVLAMQCLPTQAITRRETGSWKWPIFQIVYMTLFAYLASFLTYRIALIVT